MPVRKTHTYAVMTLSLAAYNEISVKLRDAGYDHAFIETDGEHGVVLDMHGIGLAVETDKLEPGSLTVAD